MQKIYTLLGNNVRFTWAILLLVAIAGLVTGQSTLAMWFGFLVAAFSAVSNDSIQTLGAFLASTRKVAWYWLWLFIGGIMIATVTYGWYSYAGDISYGRLNQIPQPQNIHFVQLLAPIFLIMFTRLRMPISTTFLLLATFSSGSTINGMLHKTVTGYLLAFFVSLLAWMLIGYVTQRLKNKHKKTETLKSSRVWSVLLWLSTGFLWSAWLMQDNANAAVFLPRSLDAWQLGLALLVLMGMLAYILKRRGGEIQSVVNEKSDVTHVRSAALINLVYGGILVYFKELNELPMSTTWVFLGLLAGREIALMYTTQENKQFRHTTKLIMKDLIKASIGLVASILLAYATKII